MKSTKKVRLKNDLIEVFTNLPKSTNTGMSWLLLHKAMEESVSSNKNLMKFNLGDFIEEYSIDYKRTDNIKRDLVRDFKKLKNQVEIETVNELGHKQTDTYYFFQKTRIDHETLEVEVVLNEDIYHSVSEIPDKNYFQFLKQEAILIANKKMTPNDIKLLLYIKSHSHNAKESYVKINIDKLKYVLGQSNTLNWNKLQIRHIDPFIERCLDNTNYVISYEVQKNKLNKRKIESILFRVDNRKEKVNIIGKQMQSEDPEIYDIGYQGMSEFSEKKIATHMIEHEDKVKSKISDNKFKQQLKEQKKKQEEKENVVEEIKEVFGLFKFD